jgi:hypothetical protein
MKRFQILTIALAGAFVLSSCEELEKLGDVDFGLPVEKTFAVNQENPTEPDGSAVFTYNDNIVLADYEEFEEYKDVVKSVNVKKITAMISNYVGGPAVEFSGDLEINGNAFKMNIPAVTLSNEAFVELEEIDGSIAKLGEVLTSAKEVSYDAILRVSETPVAFDLKLIFDIEVKAGALK